MSALLAVQVIIGSVAGLLVCGLTLNAVQRWRLRRSGYGIRALQSFASGSPRPLEATVVRLPAWSGAWDEGSVAEKPFTVITVPHAASLPWVLEIQDGEAGRLDKSGFEGWSQRNGAAGSVPYTLRLPAREQASEDLGSLLDALELDELAPVRGVLRVEPTQVRYVEQGDLLEPAYLPPLTYTPLMNERGSVPPRFFVIALVAIVLFYLGLILVTLLNASGE